ncbi:dessication-associated protein [Flavipsychrobacter stenotrophus]|uniref:Dessication-associated protein n=1 Tax=Flavipsychrobacter stenotrophus TaxID=2077091 RepID=A0A2S7SY65_9BACT|nr:ferritin-like domain-containing protein [Flavipsychrobacter stenotrophus]PQJ11862.1 dessication-associated protein [Flavipsychrobacter stenotrophus]
MNFNHILQEIEKADPEVYEKVSGRRNILKSFGSKVALAALPIALGSMFKKAYGKTTGTVISTLQFALELEYLEYNFYHTGYNTGSNTTGSLIPANDRPGFAIIESEEKMHINFLRTTIDTLGAVPFTPNGYTGDPITGNPYSPASYDFTAHGAFTTFSNYGSFLDLAAALEDTGIRAYQGQLPNLLANTNGVLTSAMQIASVEGRHASFVRLVRRFYNTPSFQYGNKPWITTNFPPSVPLQPNYMGEDNTVQKGVDITTLTGFTGYITPAAASEAFDEPMDEATVRSLIASFKL